MTAVKKTKFTKSSSNVFNDLGFDDVEARNLQFRSHLMTLLVKYIEHKDMTQKEAAEFFNVTQPRVSNLVHGKIEVFGVGVLLEMMEKAGFKIYDKVEKVADTFFKTNKPSRIARAA